MFTIKGIGIQEYRKKYRQKNRSRLLEYQKEYRELHREEKKEYNRKYCLSNKDKISEGKRLYSLSHQVEMKEYRRLYYLSNKDELQKRQRDYRLAHKSGIKEQRKAFRLSHKDRINIEIKKWRVSHPDKVRKCQNRWAIKRRSTCRGKLDNSMGYAIRNALQGVKAGRKWETLVDYTVDDLIKHLESKFEPWMNWNNYNKWDIDHIKPKSLFHYTCPEDKEFKECWALGNLQPMEHIANLKKFNHYKNSPHSIVS